MIIEISSIQTSEKLQPRIEFDMFAVDDYAQAYKANQILPPVELVFDGDSYWLWDGYHRKRAAEQAGVVELEANVQEGSLEFAEWLACGANKTHGLRRTSEDKRRAVKLALCHPEAVSKSDRQIALHCGVDPKTVGNIRKVLESTMEIPQSDRRNGIDGRTINVTNIGRTRKSASEGIVPEVREGLRDTNIVENQRKQERLAKKNKEKQLELVEQITEGESIIIKDSHQLINVSDENEWYTPEKYILAVHEVMGAIDLDPASSWIANNTVRAIQIYTKSDDGLSKNWPGRVFLNPPYGYSDDKRLSNQAKWSSYLIEQFKAKITTEAILLVNAVPSNKWFTPLWEFPICFTDHRIRFYDIVGEVGQPTHSNCFVYMGLNIDKFDKVFSQFGTVAVRRSLAF